MRLVTQFGSIELPEDFSFEVERTNPFLSDEGDATIPATIPASQRNLNILENIDRVDKAFKFIKKVPAVLQHGVFCKHGQLVIDTVNRKNGIAVSFAIENSDVYSQYKNKSLKEILKNKVRREWATLDDLIAYMNEVAFDTSETNKDDFDLCTVAVAKYEDAKNNVVYQFNNEIYYHHYGFGNCYRLVSDGRTVQEDGYVMGVPQGYGISPFLYLGKAIDVIFEEMGYHVVSNCFNIQPLNKIVLLNNSSDTIVGGYLPYADMVPSCTLTEFIDFLKNKFCATIRVDSSSKEVWVELMQNLIQNKAFDLDISKIVDDEFEIMPNESSRVVLSSDTSMEGSEPAALTMDELVEKYGFFVDVNESQFGNIGTTSQTIFDCLIRRKITGEFYELKRNLKTGKNVAIKIGTDYFNYDRNNSDNIEEYGSRDVMPPVIQYKNLFYLYIGDRVHNHTSFRDKQEDDKQPIMVCWSFKKNDGIGVLPIGGVSKCFVGLGAVEKPFSLTPYDMYEYFWSNYNNLLLNNKVTVRGRVAYSDKQLAALDMVTPKYYKGQILLPESMSYNLGKNKGANESQFVLIKDFIDQITDKPISPLSSPLLKWQLDDSEVTNYVSQYWNEKKGYHYYNNQLQEIAHTQSYQFVEGAYFIQIVYDHRYSKTDVDEVYLGPPSFEGQVGFTYEMNFRITLCIEQLIWNGTNWQYYYDHFIEQYGDFHKPARFVAVPV